MLLLPKKCLDFWKIQPWVSLADFTLFVGVHKSLSNFWFKRVEDCYIRVCQIVVTKRGVLLTIVKKPETHGCLFKKTKQFILLTFQYMSAL